tara:strand:- start:4429 stop:4635 length:207 start_codon:yes stop_codon:yes gene_type:complete
MLSYLFTDAKYEKNKKLAIQIIKNIDQKIKELKNKEETLSHKKLEPEDYDYIEKKLIIIEALKYFYNL